MNKAKLKTYAPQARKDFIAAVEARANLLGLSENNGMLDIAASEKKGDVAVIAGQAWPAKVHDQRQRLIKRMKKDGFAQTVEAVAYTWFNRFAALRFMEIHDYLGHGYRVLSSREGGLPEIIAHATEVTGSLPGLNAAQIADMKLAGNKDGELYRLLLVAQCNALSNAMPFLFERIDDESELLLPGNLERTDSVVAKLVEAVAEEDWNEIEVIGWLYQFYISEKKDAVIGKVVKSEDIPAATQLFTPNWIVQYLVQNSVGRLWLMANPGSRLKSQWPYYIEPAEQTPEVQAQLDALIQTRMADDGGSRNPETITVLDPACGSGHILVVAYDVLKAIYLERGYQPRAIPRLILEKNLYGLDIDDRAAQMAGFALMMKARADDRRLLDSPIRLNVLSLQESKGLELDELVSHLKPFGIDRQLLASLLDTFAHAKTFGSLIQIFDGLASGLPALVDGLAKAKQSGDVFAEAAAQDLVPLVEQAAVLAMKFRAVVANPPYMGIRYYSDRVKKFIENNYLIAKGDLYTCFMVRNHMFSTQDGLIGMITIPNWMFLASFDEFRSWLISSVTVETLSHNGRGVFGSDFGSCAFTLRNSSLLNFVGKYRRLFDKQGSVSSNEELRERFFSSVAFKACSNTFKDLPKNPIAYWLSQRAVSIFKEQINIGQIAIPRKGMATGDNNRYVRQWTEVEFKKIGLGMTRENAAKSSAKWFPYANGGGYRKWYGILEDVVLWENDGEILQREKLPNGVIRAVGLNLEYIFKEGVTWSPITSALFSSRLLQKGCLFSSASNTLFPCEISIYELLGQVNSVTFEFFSKVVNPTLNLNTGDVANIPVLTDRVVGALVEKEARLLVDLHKADWDLNELSLDFLGCGFTHKSEKYLSLKTSWLQYSEECKTRFIIAHKSEECINISLADAFQLREDIDTEVPVDQIKLVRADREKDCQHLISYAVGCMMGRYSLDEPGLIYANAGNVGFDATRYKTFSADTDGIVPITDERWFEDDAANRVRDFLNAVWGLETLDENMAWLAESLGRKGNETPEETLRRYLSDSLYKDHLQTYKKRPIYWHFSSGKQGAFQALVYLHRYHEGTLARLRAEYVVPLTGKLQSRIEMLEKDRDSAGSTAARTKITKQIESMKKKHVELLAYDEKLRHYADMRIQLDLDDGVKVNYGKFGDLLAEVKAVTGGAADE